MLVFSKQKLVFLAMPKTGSSAYHTALAPLADLVITDPPDLKHAPLYRYNRWIRPMYERVLDLELEVMAVMREPVSWLGSWYRYRQRPFLNGSPNSTANVSFDSFVQGYMRGRQPAYAQVGSQSEFLKPQKNGTHVHHLFKYEEPEKLNRFLEKRLGTSFTLGQENVSPPGDLSLTPATRTKLQRKNAHEFELYHRIGDGTH